MNLSKDSMQISVAVDPTGTPPPDDDYASEGPASDQESRRRKRTQWKASEGEFGFPESGYDTLTKMIRAFYRVGRGTATLSPSDVARAAGIDRTQISRNNKFFISIGILRKEGNTFSLTPKGGELGLALDYEDQGDVAKVWRDLILKNEFLSKILFQIELRGGVKRDDLASQITKSAKLPPTNKFLLGANALGEIILRSSLVGESDGVVNVNDLYHQLRQSGEAASGDESSAAVPSSLPSQAPRVSSVPRSANSDFGSFAEAPARHGLVVNLNVEVVLSPEMSDDDAGRMASHLRQILRAATDPQRTEHDATDEQ